MGSVQGTEELMPQPCRLPFIPLERGHDVGLGGRANAQLPHLPAAVRDASSNVRPGCAGVRLCLPFRQALVEKRLLRLGHG